MRCRTAEVRRLSTASPGSTGGGAEVRRGADGVALIGLHLSPFGLVRNPDLVIDVALVTWFVLTAFSVAYVAWDAWRRTPEMTVMKWGWVLVTLYTGPVGAAVYVLSCQEPRPGAHEAFVRPLWKQGLGSTIHCLAGDATGIIVGAAVTAALGLRMWQDLIGEYVFGFAFGLLIFQALFMRDMLGGSYARALRLAFLPEWLSMNAVMAGMVPVMVVLMSRDMRAMEPTSLRFWGAMSLATLVGGAVAYPLNVWLVAAGLKHGMGTVRVLGEGGHGLAAERRATATGTAPAPVAPRGAAMHHGAEVVPATPSADFGVPGAAAAGATPPELAQPNRARMTGMAMAGLAGRATASAPAPRAATRPQIVAVTGLTLLALAAGVLLAALHGDLTMRAGMRIPSPVRGDAPHTMPM